MAIAIHNSYYLKNDAATLQRGHEGEIRLTANCAVMVNKWINECMHCAKGQKLVLISLNVRTYNGSLLAHAFSLFCCCCCCYCRHYFNACDAAVAVNVYITTVWDTVPHAVSKNSFQLVWLWNQVFSFLIYLIFWNVHFDMYHCFLCD